MRYKVVTLRRAERDYTAILEYIAARSTAGAQTWARAFDHALARLEDHADAFPLAAESEFVNFELREILFKSPRGLMYRALFTIQENTVLLLHVRGPGQDFLHADDINSPNGP